MKGFDNKFIEELKAKNDIIDVVGKYVRLEQRGNNFWGKCPFHHEKTASFTVNGIEQFYYCFGCHKSGDVISFIMELESLDFSDAVKYLAERVKMPLPEVRYDDEKVKEQKKKKERVLDLLKETALFYVSNLKKEGSDKHIEYILRRGIKGETISKFGIGASLDYTSLPQYLKQKGYTYQEMVDSGAVGEKDGRYYDSLGGRLIIPVIDQFGSVVAFCGRLIEDRKNVGKYVNTKETIAFSKGKTLFNLNNLKKLKNEKGIDSIIIVEGHMDVVSMVQGGFPNVVASMGTSLTKDQARILKRYADKVFISYDGDFAGQKASIRGLEILKEEGLDVKVVSLPDGMDPDDVIKKLGAEEYKKLLLSAMPLIDFKLDILRRTYDLSNADGKRKFVSSAMRVIKESPSPAEQEDLIKTVRDLTGFTFESLQRELAVADIVKPKTEKVETEILDSTGDKITVASRFILAGFIFSKPYAKEFNVKDFSFPNNVHRTMQAYIIEKQEKGEKIRFNDFYEIFEETEKEEVSKIASLFTDDNKDFDKAQYFIDCVRTLKLSEIDSESEKIVKLFKEETDVDKRRDLAEKLNKLMNEKKKYTVLR